jgi:hypothetical protein
MKPGSALEQTVLLWALSTIAVATVATRAALGKLRRRTR